MKREISTIDGYGNLTVPEDTAAIWMSEPEIVELFGVIAPTLRAAMKALSKSGVIRECETKRYLHLENGNGSEVYNLEMIIALAFRIESSGAAKVREYVLRTLRTVNKQPAVNILIACTHKTEGCRKGPFFN